MGPQVDSQGDARGDASLHIRGGAQHYRVDVLALHAGPRTYFREAGGYHREAVDIFVHLGDHLLVGTGRAQQFDPGHQRGNRGAELMGRLFRQSHPYFVLLGLAGGVDGEVDHGDKRQHHKNLHVRIIAQTLEQLGVVVVEMLEIVGGDDDVDYVGAFLQGGKFPAQVSLVGGGNHPGRR